MPRNFESYYFIEGEPVYPCIGFGTRIPQPDEAIARLVQADTARNGMQLLDRMNKENERLNFERELQAHEVNQEVAERIEHEMRTSGDTEKYTKVFMGG